MKPEPLDYAPPPRRRRWPLAAIVATVIAVIVGYWAIGWGPPPPVVFSTITQSGSVLTPTINPAVACRVVAMDFDTMQPSSGSGFFVSADGLLVTARHVVKGKTPIGVELADGRQLTCSDVLADDESHDLAIVRVDGKGFPFVPLGYRSPAPGDFLWAVTRNGAHIATAGDAYTDANVGTCAGFAAELGPGDSGGALLDTAGVLVGVIIGAVDDDPRQCGAVPVAAVRALVSRLSLAGTSGSGSPR